MLHPSRRSGLDSLRRGSHWSYAGGARPHPRPLALIACPPPRLTAMYYGGLSRADARSRSHTPAFGSSGGLFHIPGSLSPSLKILGIIPKKQTYKRALQRRYLERCCIHTCIQLCTRGYTVVYTRVYSSLLGRRDTLGSLHLGHGYFYLRRMLPHDLALAR